ncbi:GNAT family N-acetyltransferase [Peribacillus frigoritolerans]|uniref:GNAT family N-acetyltransferase n=1 Tax=Peribacillus frigoritolerans TaxID=450367 RepID=UPI0033065CE7
MFPLLNTERLRLREIHESDAEALFQCLSKDEVTRFYGQDSLENVEQAKDIVASFAKNHREKRAIRWGIGFNDLDSTRIGAVVFLENLPSSELFLKQGFIQEGILRSYIYQNGIPHDTYVYSLLK